MVNIPDLGDDFHSMWAELMTLWDVSVPQWTLIGAHMVALHGWIAGRDQVRQSRDADVLVNARAVTDATKASARSSPRASSNWTECHPKVSPTASGRMPSVLTCLRRTGSDGGPI
jgi:hypothetical protein